MSDPDEVVNQSQTYITSAGWKNSFAYDKMKEILIKSIFDSDNYMAFGGDYKLAILEGALKNDMVTEMKVNGTYDESSFDREYGSIWSGDSENAYFSSATFDRHRTLLTAESEYSARGNKNAYYILSMDVGRSPKGCSSEICVIKVNPQVQGDSHKVLVNIFSIEDGHFEEQAIFLKKLYYKFKAKCCVIDANGLGIGFVDFLVKSQDTAEGDYLPPFGVAGGTYENAGQEYKRYRTDDTVRDALYLIKANAPINTEAHSYVQAQISSGKVKFLIDEQTAKVKLGTTKVGQNMTPEERNEYLMPYQQTSILKNQMLNLIQSNEGINTILKQQNLCIPKDKFSAFEYGLYYIKQIEAKKRGKKTSRISDLMFFSNGR